MDKSTDNIGGINGDSTHSSQLDYAKFTQKLIQLEEDNKQIKYELKRKTETFEANEKSSNDEIEYWKGEYNNLKKQMLSQSNQFEEERIRMQNMHAEETSSLSEEMHKWQLENEKLMKQLKDIQNRSIVENNDVERIQELEVEVSNLKEKLNDQCIELNLAEKKSSKLEDINMALLQENEEYKQSLSAKRDEVRKSNEVIIELQDEITVLRRELDLLQTQPQDINAKGNSLFAEVYDSRNQIKEKFLELAEKYQRIIKEKESLSNEVDILRKETITLREIFNNDMKNFRPGNMYEASGDSDSMSAMKTLLKSYKEELDKIKQEEPPAERDFQYYETVIERQRRELKQLRETLSDHTLAHSMRARKVSELGVTVAFWKSQASECESEKRFLKLKIQELENKILDLQPQNRKVTPNKTKFVKSKQKTPEKPKEKSLSELYGTHKITIISREEMKALMENKPYPSKEDIKTCTNIGNKENEQAETKIGETNECQKNLPEECTDNNKIISESSNKIETSKDISEAKKTKKTIHFSETTKKEDGEGYRPKGRNRYVFNFQVKKID